MFQTGIQYTPVDSIATCLTLLLLQPFSQAFQFLRESQKFLFGQFSFRLAAHLYADTYADGILVDIQTRATAVE